MTQQFEVHSNLVADWRRQLLERADEALGARLGAPPAVDVKSRRAYFAEVAARISMGRGTTLALFASMGRFRLRSGFPVI
jgi:hypothetical protein